MNNATGKTVNNNVAYKPNAHNGFGAIYMDTSKASVTFLSNKAGRNPEILMAFNVIKQSGFINGIPHGVIFGNPSGGYAFGPYKTQENYFRVLDSSGVGLMSDTMANFNSWHIANIYWGDDTGFLRFDGGKFSEFDGISNFQVDKLEYIGIGGTPLSPNHHAANYIGEVLIFNEKLSDSDRSMITTYLMTKWAIGNNSVTINGKHLYQDSDGWILIAAYKHKAGENLPLVENTPPLSPTSGYSHIWLDKIGISDVNDIKAVRFYCETSHHTRKIHFTTENEYVKNSLISGIQSSWNGVNSYIAYTSGFTAMDDHTGNLPALANGGWDGNDLFSFPFSRWGNYHWSVHPASSPGASSRTTRFECDDDGAQNNYNTLHQIWFKRKL